MAATAAIHAAAVELAGCTTWMTEPPGAVVFSTVVAAETGVKDGDALLTIVGDGVGVGATTSARAPHSAVTG